MAKMQDYLCRKCGGIYEYLCHGAEDTATCPACGSGDASIVPGGRTLGIIIPVYPGSKRVKAGYQHTHGDRPAEKISVAVPRTKGD